MAKLLIVNSDDFGISAGVNRGILEAHRDGIVTSTTAMMNMPDAEAGIREAQKSAPKLGIGVHFNLSFGKPLLPAEQVPSLVTSEGTFVSSYQALMEKLPSFDADDLERELTAQFQHYVDIAGHLPTHLDSHHGSTYFHPASFALMLRLAKTHNLPLRWSDDGFSSLPTNADGSLTSQFEASIALYGMPRRTDYFVDYIFSFASTPRLERLKAGLLTVAEGTTELMVHVGYGDDLTEAYTFQRQEELVAIIDPSVRALIATEGIQLATFADLPK